MVSAPGLQIERSGFKPWLESFVLSSLSTQEYIFVPGNCQGNLIRCLGGNLRWTSISSRGSSNTRGDKWYLENCGSWKLFCQSRNLGTICDESGSLVFCESP